MTPPSGILHVVHVLFLAASVVVAAPGSSSLTDLIIPTAADHDPAVPRATLAPWESSTPPEIVIPADAKEILEEVLAQDWIMVPGALGRATATSDDPGSCDALCLDRLRSTSQVELLVLPVWSGDSTGVCLDLAALSVPELRPQHAARGCTPKATHEHLVNLVHRVGGLLPRTLLPQNPAPEPEVARSRLQVVTNPSAEVWINGRNRGWSPVDVEVEPGTHLVAVVPPPAQNVQGLPWIAAPVVDFPTLSLRGEWRGVVGVALDQTLRPCGERTRTPRVRDSDKALAGVGVVLAGGLLLAASEEVPPSTWRTTSRVVEVEPGRTERVTFRARRSVGRVILQVLGWTSVLAGVVLLGMATE